MRLSYLWLLPIQLILARILALSRLRLNCLFEGLKLLDADFVATGHFAATAFCSGRFRLYKGADPEKDQSYFLWMLSQSDLAKTLFPLGELTKPEVRSLARSFGVRAAEKKERVSKSKGNSWRRGR